MGGGGGGGVRGLGVGVGGGEFRNNNILIGDKKTALSHE